MNFEEKLSLPLLNHMLNVAHVVDLLRRRGVEYFLLFLGGFIPLVNNNVEGRPREHFWSVVLKEF